MSSEFSDGIDLKEENKLLKKKLEISEKKIIKLESDRSEYEHKERLEKETAIDITERKNIEMQLRESEVTQSNLFENSPISLWQEDFSEVKKYIDNLKIENFDMFKEYLEQNPGVIRECAALVKINDVNQATLDLYKVKNKEELLEGLPKFNEESYNAFKILLLAIYQGKTLVELKSSQVISDGSIRIISLRWSIVPSFEETLERVLISMVDITEETVAFKELEMKANQQQMVVEFGKVALDEPSLPILYDYGLKIIFNALNIELCYIAEIKPDNKSIHMVAGLGWNDGLVGVYSRKFHEDSQSKFTLNSNSPVIVNDYDKETRFRLSSLITTHNVRSGVTFRITMHKLDYGILGVFSQQFRQFSSFEVGFIESIANIFASAIENNRNIKTIKAEEEHYRALIDSSPLGLAVIQDGLHKVVNPEFLRMFGYENADELVGNPFTIILAPKIVEHLEKRVSRRSEGHDEPTYYETIGIRKDGTEFPFHVNVKLITYQGKPASLGYIEDITERKIIAERLEKSRIMYQNLFDNTPIPTFLDDYSEVKESINNFQQMESKEFRTYLDDHPEEISKFASKVKIINVNQAAIEFFGAKNKNELLNNIDKIYNEQMLEYIKKELISMHNNLTGFRVETSTTTLSGKKVEIIVNWSVVMGYEQNYSRVIVSIIDFTAQKQIEEELMVTLRDLDQKVNERTLELQNTNKELSGFTYSVTHDLRAPLRAMQGFTTILADDYIESLDEEGIDVINRIREAAEKMDSMIEDLLIHSRLSQKDIKLTNINLEKYFLNAIEINQVIISKKKIKIDLDITHEVIASETIIAQIINNLFSNAIKFTGPGSPHIKIWSKKIEDTVRLYIEDNGIGIREEYFGKIFNVFERLHTTEYHGTGIGLAIVKRGIEKMGGNVGVESVVGEFTRFWIDFPNKQ